MTTLEAYQSAKIRHGDLSDEAQSATKQLVKEYAALLAVAQAAGDAYLVLDTIGLPSKHKAMITRLRSALETLIATRKNGGAK